MKIALVGNEYKQQFPLIGYGGIETCVEQLAQGLHQAGADFYVIVPKRRRGLFTRIPRYPVEVVEVDFAPSSLTGLRPEQFMKKVEQVLLSSHKPDIVWGQSEWSISPALRWNIPVGATLQGSSMEKEPGLMVNHPGVYYRFISKFQYAQQVVEDWERSCSTQIYTGLSKEEYDFSGEEGQYFLWVAGFNWGWSQKGLDLFVDLAKGHCDKHFLCYGSGDKGLEEKLTKLSRKLGNFEYRGELKRGPRHRKAFREARAFLMLSRTGEAMGRTILESLSKGTPVIGRKTGAVPEMVGVHGYCSNEFTEIEQALEQRYSRSACYDYSRTFSVANEVSQMLAFSQRILSGL